jgi:HD superfamily phosphohydrolase
VKKKKIINDPVYGFITIDHPLVFDIIQHPGFQRLRHIRQLGLTDMVYPGALHTRFHHALGAMHLMNEALNVLAKKRVDISPAEREAALAAILLHDAGHGPFSHTLEETLLSGVGHESLSYRFISALNEEFDGTLDLTLRMFRNSYERKFFHDLVNSQLDMDRLDYLARDSFFTGVTEGAVGVNRIIQLLNVVNDEVVVEEKGIYTIEQFLQARRLMYWQVYLHKTAISAERMLVNIIRRAQHLASAGAALPGSRALLYFLKQPVTLRQFQEEPAALAHFAGLDDHDIWGAVKQWKNDEDEILATLCRMLLHRELFRIELSARPVHRTRIEKLRSRLASEMGVLQADTPYFFSHGALSNEAYVAERRPIKIWMKNGELMELSQAGELANIQALGKIVRKNYVCWPKSIILED